MERPGDAPLRTCTIITGAPNELLGTLHHRMAVILEPEHEEIWLDPALPMENALALLGVFPDAELEAFEVEKKVGNVVYDDPSCIEPLQEEAEVAAEQGSLF
jgi:putative SOS response-associated peptidase YedK